MREGRHIGRSATEDHILSSIMDAYQARMAKAEADAETQDEGGELDEHRMRSPSVIRIEVSTTSASASASERQSQQRLRSNRRPAPPPNHAAGRYAAASSRMALPRLLGCHRWSKVQKSCMVI